METYSSELYSVNAEETMGRIWNIRNSIWAQEKILFFSENAQQVAQNDCAVSICGGIQDPTVYSHGQPALAGAILAGHLDQADSRDPSKRSHLFCDSLFKSVSFRPHSSKTSGVNIHNSSFLGTNFTVTVGLWGFSPLYFINSSCPSPFN